MKTTAHAPRSAENSGKLRTFCGCAGALVTNAQVRGPSADGLAHRPGSVRRTPSRACGWRPSIWDDRCRPPRAVHPRISGGPPIRAGPPAVTVGPFLTLLQAGFTEPRRSPAVLVVSCTTVSPLPRQPEPTWRSVFCGTFPRVAPGGCYPPPCPVEPGPSSTPVPRDEGRGRPASPSARQG